MNFLTGWKTVIVAAIWLLYDIITKVVPDFQVPDKAVVDAAVQAFLDMLGPLVMLGMRVITKTPVGESTPVVPK